MGTKSRSGAKAKTPRFVRIDIARWSQFVDIVQDTDFRNWCFRGQRDARWPLKTSLARHIEVSKIYHDKWSVQEQRIRRIFERKSHLFTADTPKTDDDFEWLALMQHHGAPTRLLDFTWSPYVAAFFGFEQATDDIAIWALNVPLLWKIHEKKRFDGLDVRKADPRNVGAYQSYYLPNRHAFVWIGDPLRMSQRVVAQSGTFLVSSHLGMNVDDIIATYASSAELLIKFVFPTSKVRAEAMSSLYSMNITQATLFPGLDGLARSMAYEFEYSWQFDLVTGKPLRSFADPRLPKTVRTS